MTEALPSCRDGSSPEAAEPGTICGEAPQREPFWVRTLAWVAARGIVSACEIITGLVSRPGASQGRSEARPKRAFVMLTGTFLSDGWLAAHLAPLAASEACERVLVVADKKMISFPKVTYACPPRWLQRLIGRVPARSVLYVLLGLLRRPDICGGFHLLCNGMLALVTSRLIGAQSIYFCGGGRTEILGGGFHSENRLFTRIGQDDPVGEKALLRIVRRFDMTITMGRSARDFILQRAAGARVSVQPGGIDAARFSSAPIRPQYDVVGVFRLAPVKRIDIFLRVIARVAERYPGVRAVIVGNGPLWDELIRLRDELGLTGNVEFVGQQSDVPAWLARSRICLLTSDSEGVSLSVMEALTAGKPVVVSDVGDLRDVVTHGSNGFLVRRRDVDGYAEALAGLLSDPQRLTACEEAARGSATRFSLAAASGWWTDVLSRPPLVTCLLAIACLARITNVYL